MRVSCTIRKTLRKNMLRQLQAMWAGAKGSISGLVCTMFGSCGYGWVTCKGFGSKVSSI